MDLDVFLALRETSLNAVLAKADEALALNADEVLLAVGSLVEGWGTVKSDLDLIWITPRGEESLPPREHVTLVVGRCLVDLRVLRLSELEELLDRFETWAGLPWNLTHAVKFSIQDRTLLHRLIHCRLLHEDKDRPLASRKPSPADLARLKLHVARQDARTIQVDMVGYRTVGDFRSLAFAAQALLGHAVDALLAGHQRTNPLVKWRSRMLEALPLDWERSLPIRPTGLTASEVVWGLHRVPEHPDEALVLEHAYLITTFARAVFAWAELQLVNGVVPLLRTTWAGGEHQPNGAALAPLDFDVDFALCGDRFLVARLNEFEEAVELTPQEFVLALLFDGRMTATEADRTVDGTPNGGGAARLVERLGHLTRPR